MRNCDIVMKGGVTSGIVYPAAVYEISKRFVFKNVGGTSAGAIAAALTAAAEFCRQSRSGSAPDSGFISLGNVPSELEQNSLLFRLFHPNPYTRSLYHTVLALAGRQTKPAELSRLLRLIRAFPVASLIGAAPGLAFLIASIAQRRGGFSIACSAILALVGVVLADIIALVLDLRRKLPGNFYGLITGFEQADGAPVLTSWLHDKIQSIAGLKANDPPLTFSMLWSASAISQPLQSPPDEPSVNLEMITTNLTFGRPYQFPISVEGFYFKPAELAQFFPDSVVQWMRNHGRPAKNPRSQARHDAYAKQQIFPLPPAGDFPVIVATRMSLSFPILLSAVPMYTVDYSAKPDDAGIYPIKQCWFSDGGLSSNFPIALFDSPLPRWPTFAINLQGFPSGRERSNNEAENVYMPATNTAGRLPMWTQFSDVGGFVGAIVNAMQNWHDVTLTPLPGYRDRIVTIFMDKDEGGLNLDMPSDILQRLRERGRVAGQMIAARFDDPRTGMPQSDAPNMNWANHRWLRYRSTMGALRSYLTSMAFSYRNPQPGDPPFAQFIRQKFTRISYRIPARRTPNTQKLTDDAVDLGNALQAEQGFVMNLPQPIAQLGIKPPLQS